MLYIEEALHLPPDFEEAGLIPFPSFGVPNPGYRVPSPKEGHQNIVLYEATGTSQDLDLILITKRFRTSFPNISCP